MSAEDCAPDCDERTACPQVGGIGHWQCGICPEHNEPRHHCGCMVYEPVTAPERTEAEMAERIAAFEAAPAAPESWTEAPRPVVDGFPHTPGYPSWLSWIAPDDSWCVTYGDDGDGIFSAPSGEQVITVSAGEHSRSRWFSTTDPRGLAAALIAAADEAAKR